jgi:hypothetical protein
MSVKKIKNNSWLIEIKENQKTKELYFELPHDALSQVGWDTGDVLSWEELDNGNWRISKKEE